jgi:quercetin dioxygenase-like cupin family protein
MTKIRFHDERRFISLKDMLIQKLGPGADFSRYADEALRSEVLVFEEGDESTPQFSEAHVLPLSVAELHSHDEDEIMYILEGEVLFGKRSLKQGSAIFIEAKTPYGFRVGEAGARILVFRPRRAPHTPLSDRAGPALE